LFSFIERFCEEYETGFINGASEALKGIKEKMIELEATNEEGKEPSEEEVKALVTGLDSVFTNHKEAVLKANRQISVLTQNLKNVESGPYAEFKEELPKLAETLKEQQTEIKDMTEKRWTAQKSIVAKEHERRTIREKAEQEKLAEELKAEAAPQDEKVNELTARLAALDEKELPKMTDSVAEFQNGMKSIRSDIDSIKEAGTESKKWIEEKWPKQPKGAVFAAVASLKKIRSNVSVVLNKCESWLAKLKHMNLQFKEKLRVDFAIFFKGYLVSKGIDEEALFKNLSKNKDTLSLEAFGKFAKTLVKGLDSADELVKASLGAVTEITKDHLTELSKVSYRCLKRALITDIVDIKTCKKLKTIEPEEIVEVLDRHVKCEKTGLTRFKARASDGTEGYVTIKGNMNTTYLKFQQSWYRVVKETVFTDNFEMKNFKVLRRLKEGDYIRELSRPTLEEKSGLYRMKAQAVDDNEIGWVTLKGNAGSQFLLNCEMPPPKVAEEKGEGDEVKAAAEEKDVDMTAEKA